MRRLLVWTIAGLFGLTSADAGRPHCTLRVHTLANAQDGAPFSTPLSAGTVAKNVTIEKIPTLSERDVVGFYPYPAPDGSYGVLLQLDDHGRLALDTLSVEKRGTNLYIFVNGRFLTEMQVDRRVSDGRLYIASGLTQSDLDLMKKDWRLLGKRKS